MTKEQILKDIVEWEKFFKKDFLEHFDKYLDVPTVMFWAFGKGYISPDNFKKWESSHQDYRNYEVKESFYYIANYLRIFTLKEEAEDWQD